MAFTTEKDYSGRGEGGELTPQEEIFIQNLAAQCVYDSNKVVRLNSNNGGLAKNVLKVDDSGNYLVWGSINWGEITGTLSNQTDLQNALNQKADDSIVLKKDGSVVLTSNWNVDGAGTLFIDKVNGRIGIGTTNPTSKLQINSGNIQLNNPSATTINTTIGSILGQVYPRNEPAAFASIDFVTDNPWYTGALVFKTNSSDGTNPATPPLERMRITNSGNVGIGTTSPAGAGTGSVLEISGSQRGQLVLSNTGTTPRRWHLASFGDSAGIFGISDLNAGGATRLVINTSGNVGIGTTNPVAKLHVNDATVSTYTPNGTVNDYITAGINNSPSSGNNYALLSMYAWGVNYSSLAQIGTVVDNSTWGPMVFRVRDGSSSVTEKMRITATGNVGVGTTNPTAKLHIQGSTGYNQLRLATSYTPTSSSDTNGNVGDIAWDDNFIYIKTSGGWKRAALSTF